MIERDCLFLSGESSLTMKCVFRRERWMHTCSSTKLIYENNILRRNIYPREKLNAIVFYADMDNKELELENLLTIKRSGVPCWPNINSLIEMIDRRETLRVYKQEKLIDHNIAFISSPTGITHKPFNYPIVLKVGNTHRGQNKFLLNSSDDWKVIKWSGERSSIEPYFVGDSVRALLIGKEIFGIKIDNNINWIKNQHGAEISMCILGDDIKQHAQQCAQIFDLDVAGVDYIVENNGKFHFLECNQFPGLSNIDDNVSSCVETFLDNIMSSLEASAS